MSKVAPHVTRKKPQNPQFSSGPCRPPAALGLGGGVAPEGFETYAGRSHRAPECRALILRAFAKTRSLLAIPEDYQIALVPGSATGAMGMAMWNFLGHRPLTAVVTDEFSRRWYGDARDQLRLSDITLRDNIAGACPDLRHIEPSNDVMLCLNGSTSGLRLPVENFLSSTRTGLVVCDITSAAFTMPIAWPYLDVTIFSWQKGLGSEAAHGMMVLSPRALRFLGAYTAPWPIPYALNLKRNGRLNTALFDGYTINTPSMRCIYHYDRALSWAQEQGGAAELHQRSQNNLKRVENFVNAHAGFSFFTQDPSHRSNSTVCLRVHHKDSAQNVSWDFVQAMATWLAEQQVAYDLLNHPAAAYPSLRIWCGPTIQPEDLEALLLWLPDAYDHAAALGLNS